MARRAPSIIAIAVAAFTGVLGGGSLLLFGLFLWTGALGLIDLGIGEPARLTWDTALALLFFLQHSAMVRKSFRVRLRKLAPEHCHGIVYTLASAIVLLLLVLAWQPSRVDLYVATGAARWLVGAMLLLSVAGFVWGIRSLGEFDAFGIEAFLTHHRGEQRGAPRLTIEGPYRWVRHPFYFCAIVAVWSAQVLSLDRLVFNCLFTAWIVLGATLEERDLVAEFGDEYRRYQQAVYMLLPGRKQWRARRAEEKPASDRKAA